LSGSKRKRPARPSPQLFNPQAVAFSFEEQPRPGDADHIWRFNGLTFDHGLLRKTFKPGSAVPNVLVPSNVVITFCQSGYPIHPSLFEKPNRPLEWDFSPDDKVVLVSRWRKGQNAIVVAVEERALEVEVSTGEVISVPWNDVQKDIKIGGFVKVLCGLHSGETGWVDKVDDGVLHIVQKHDNKDDMASIEASFFFFTIVNYSQIDSHFPSMPTVWQW
jgi:transcription elongation factor